MPTNRHTTKAAIELYASSLVDALNAEGGIDTVLEARSQIGQVIAYNRGNTQLTDAMHNTAYSPEQRSSLVKQVFADCQPALVSVLGLMAERGEFDYLSRVLEAFDSQVAEKLNTTVVDVVTRVPLDDHLREVITSKTSADLGRSVVLNERIDPYMLGGIIMSAEGKSIDASVNTMLESARRTLKETKTEVS